MKKHILIFTLILTILTAFFQICFAKDYKFDDLYWYERNNRGELVFKEHSLLKEIEKAANINIISGYPDGSFKPDESISREEFIKMLISLATNRTFDFGNVNTNYKSWAGPYVTIAEMQGVIEKGAYTDETLKEPITRLEMVMMLSKTQIRMKRIPQNQIGELKYIDINYLTEEEKDLLLHAVKYDLLEGMKNGTSIFFRPDKNLTRAEAAAALIRIY